MFRINFISFTHKLLILNSRPGLVFLIGAPKSFQSKRDSALLALFSIPSSRGSMRSVSFLRQKSSVHYLFLQKFLSCGLQTMVYWAISASSFVILLDP